MKYLAVQRLTDPAPRPARATRRGRSGARGGFTLIELLVVIAILLMASVAVTPGYLHFMRAREVDDAARRTIALAGEARGLAVARESTVVLAYDPGAHTISLHVEPSQGEAEPEGATPAPAPVGEQLTTAGRPVPIPSEVVLAFTRSDTEQGPVIRFYSDGQADAVEMRLMREGVEPLVLSVNARTGRMSAQK